MAGQGEEVAQTDHTAVAEVDTLVMGTLLAGRSLEMVNNRPDRITGSVPNSDLAEGASPNVENQDFVRNADFVRT